MNRLIKNYKGLPKEMYIICFSTIINRLGDFVVPFLALYLTQKIGMSEGLSGFIVTISSIIAIPASLMGGKVSDMFGRKKVYIYAQSLSAAALIPCALTKNPVITVVCLLVSTFLNGFVRPAFSSMVTDILPKEKRQGGFSLQYLSINVGVAIGPILAGFLFNNLLPMLFLGDALTSFIAVYLIWKNVKETYSADIHVKVENNAERVEKGNTLQMLRKRPHLCLFFLLSAVYSFIYTQHRFSLPITMNVQFGSQGAKYFGYVMSINAISVLVLTVFISAITRKNHQLTNMVFSGLLYAIGFGMIGYINNFGLFVISTAIWTGGEILSTISSGVYVANNSPSNYRARLSAISSIGWAVGAALSTFISGAYMQVHGCKTIWTAIFFMSLIAAGLMFSLKVFSKKMEKKLHSAA